MSIWRQVEGFDDYYVSNDGKVKSFKHGKPKILTATADKRGYLYVRLTNKDGRKHFFIHRLVALTFIDNPDVKPQVNHKDGDKTNNSIDNLEWSTNDENMKHSWETGLRQSSMKGKFGINHNRSKPVVQYLNGEKIAEYGSAREAERATGVKNTNIASCCKGNVKSAGGFVWKYKEEQK